MESHSGIKNIYNKNPLQPQRQEETEITVHVWKTVFRKEPEQAMSLLAFFP